MAKHQLAAGGEVISNLVSLGRSLGYVTKEELGQPTFPTEQVSTMSVGNRVAFTAACRFPCEHLRSQVSSLKISFQSVRAYTKTLSLET